MQAVTLGLNHQLAQYNSIDPSSAASPGNAGAMDQAQLQQLVQLLGVKMLPKQTAVVECPKSMVGRVIGKGGETIKALQQYTGAMIQIDQSTDPTRVTIAGSPQSLQLAVSMVNDIVRGTFKGFAMLRQIAIGTQGTMAQFGQPQPVYVQGYGFVPPSQVYNPEDTLSASLLRTSPTGPITPSVPGGLRPSTPGGGGLTADALAALLAQSGGPSGAPGMSGAMTPPYGAGPAQPPAQQAPGGSDALIAQLLNQLASQQMPGVQQVPQQQQMQQQAPQPRMSQAPPTAVQQPGAMDPAALQALLAQAGLLGGGAGGMPAQGAPPAMGGMASSPQQGLSPSAALMMAAQAGAAGGSGTPPAMQHPSSPSPSTSPYASSAGAGMLSMMMAGGSAGQPLSAGGGSSRPLSAAGSVGSPPASVVAPPMGGTPAASTLTGLLQGTNAASSFLGTSPSTTSSPVSGSGRTSPAKHSLPPASNPPTSLKSNSGENSPLGRFGAIGSGVAVGGAASSGSAGEELLAAKMGALTTSDTAPQLPHGWSKVSDAQQGLVYYVNQLTGESTLTPPSAGANGAQQGM